MATSAPIASSRPARAVAGTVAAAIAALLASGCSLGQGTGCFVNSSLDSPSCWSGPFNLQPDFFAAIPTTNSPSLQIRLQNGVDYESFSDGMLILVDDIGEVRGDPAPDGTPRPSLLDQPLSVALSPEIVPPGVPVTAVINPAIVHATLYLNRTCRTQDVSLYAMDAVTLEADGTCNRPDGGEPPMSCGSPLAGAMMPAPASASGADAGAIVAPRELCSTCPCVTEDIDPDAGPPAGTPTVGSSTIRFHRLFDGDTTESNAQQLLTDADFDLYLGDPSEVCPGGVGPPPRCRGHLQGHFQFYFQRGRPAQPFP